MHPFIYIVTIPADELKNMSSNAVAKACSDHERYAVGDARGLSAKEATTLVGRRREVVAKAMANGTLPAKRVGKFGPKQRWITTAAASGCMETKAKTPCGGPDVPKMPPRGWNGRHWPSVKRDGLEWPVPGIKLPGADDASVRASARALLRDGLVVPPTVEDMQGKARMGAGLVPRPWAWPRNLR